MYRFFKPSRPVTKVFIHCSASDNPDHDNIATMDAWHKANGFSGVGYHLFGRKNGKGEVGRSLEKTPAAQGGHNRGTIAICLHGLAEDKFTDAQKLWLIDVCHQINDAYGGNVTFHGHREVAAKDCPVIDYRSILKLDAAGRLGVDRPDQTAELVQRGDLTGLESAEASVLPVPVLRVGSRGAMVRVLQESLNHLGYHVGEIDGRFGLLTRDAVLAFQADNHLIEDGDAGRATFEALEDAPEREINAARQAKTVTELAAGGSRIAQASVAQGVLGSVFTVGGAAALLEESFGIMTRLADSVGLYKGLLDDLGPVVGSIVVLGGVLIVLQAMKAGRARRDDYRTAKTL